jgi:hypothetical protein
MRKSCVSSLLGLVAVLGLGGHAGAGVVPGQPTVKPAKTGLSK